MKRFLSILLSVLMIMSTMSFVVSADADVITFDTTITDVPAGSKIAVNTGVVAEGHTVVATINGEEEILTPVNGKYAVEIPAGWQITKVTVKDGDAVIAETATTEFYGLEFKGDVTTLTNDSFDTDAGSLSVSDYSASLKASGDTVYGKDWSVEEVATGGNPGAYLRSFASSGSNATAINTNATGLVAMDFSVDVKFDYASLEDLIADSAKVAGDANFIHHYVRYADVSYIKANGTSGVYNSTQTSLFNYNSNGQIKAVAYDAYGTAVSKVIDINPVQWHTYRAIANSTANKLYLYVDGILVHSGCLAPAIDINLTETTTPFYLVTPIGIRNPGSQSPRSYNDVKDSETGELYSVEIGIDNLKCNNYSAMDGKSELDITIDAPVTGDVVAGTKVKIDVDSTGLKYTQREALFVNGVETPSTDGTIVAPEGYFTVYAAVVENGTIAKDAQGNDVVSDTFSFYGIAASDVNYVRYADFDDVKYGADGTTPVTGLKTYTTDGKKLIEGEGLGKDGTNGIKMVNWGNANANPYGEATAGSHSNSIATNGNINIFGRTSFDYKFENLVGASLQETLTKCYLNKEAILKYEVDYSAPANEGRKTEVIYFGIDKASGKLFARSYDSTVANGYTDILLNIDLSQWHNFAVYFDIANNTSMLYVDGVLVTTGALYAEANKPFTVTNVKWPYLYCPRYYSYSDDARGKYALAAYVDNYSEITYRTVAEAPVDAFINVTADGIGLVPANLVADEKAADMAIVARADDNTVEIFNYNAATATDTYKYFGFAKPANKVFVWKWSTLKPIVEAFDFSE